MEGKTRLLLITGPHLSVMPVDVQNMNKVLSTDDPWIQARAKHTRADMVAELEVPSWYEDINNILGEAYDLAIYTQNIDDLHERARGRSFYPPIYHSSDVMYKDITMFTYHRTDDVKIETFNEVVLAGVDFGLPLPLDLPLSFKIIPKSKLKVVSEWGL